MLVRGCSHYPVAREDVCTIPMHARMCAREGVRTSSRSRICGRASARVCVIIIIIIQKSLYTVAYSVTYQYINYLQN